MSTKSTTEETKRLKYMSPGPAGRSKESLSPIRSTEFWDKLRSEPSLKNGRQRRCDERKKADHGKFFNPLNRRNKYSPKNRGSRSSRSRSRSRSNRRRDVSSRDPIRGDRSIEKYSSFSPDRPSNKDIQDILFYQTIEKLTSYKSPKTSPDFDSQFSPVRDMHRFESSFRNPNWVNYIRHEKENRDLELLMSLGQDRFEVRKPEHGRSRRQDCHFDDGSRFESWKNLSKKYSNSGRQERQRSRSRKHSQSSRRRKSRSSTRRKSPHISRSQRGTKSRSTSKSTYRSSSSEGSSRNASKRSPVDRFQTRDNWTDYNKDNQRHDDHRQNNHREHMHEDCKEGNHRGHLMHDKGHEDHRDHPRPDEDHRDHKEGRLMQEKDRENPRDDHHRQNHYRQNKDDEDRGEFHLVQDGHHESSDFGFAHDRSMTVADCFEENRRELTDKELVDLKFPLFDSGVENQIFEKSIASYTSFEEKNSKSNTNSGNFNDIFSERLCKYYLCGYCKMGSRCNFSHKCQPLVRKKVELCLFYAGDGCSKGELCQRLHKQFPCKDFHKTRSCYLGPKKCKFSHDSLNLELENALNRFISYNPAVKRKNANDQYHNAAAVMGAHVDLDMPKHDRTNTKPFWNQRSHSMVNIGNDARPKFGNQFSAPGFYHGGPVVGGFSGFPTGQIEPSINFMQDAAQQQETCGSWHSLNCRKTVSNESQWETNQRVQGFENSAANKDKGNRIEWYDPSSIPSYDLEDVSSQSESEFDTKISPQCGNLSTQIEIPSTPRLEETSNLVFGAFGSNECYSTNIEHTKTYHLSPGLSSNNKYVSIPFEKQCSLKDPRIENFNNDASIYRGLLTSKVYLPSLPGIKQSPPEIICNYIISWRTLRPITLEPIESVSCSSSSAERNLSKEALPLGGVKMMPLDKPEIRLEIEKEIQSFCQPEFEQIHSSNNNTGEMTNSFDAQQNATQELSIKDLFCMADPTASPFA